MNEVVNKEKDKGLGKKRGRKRKDEKMVYELNRGQTKFFVDLSKEKVPLEKVFDLLSKSNEKDYGREVTFKDIALFGIDKITDKDLERLRDGSLSEMEKVDKARDEYNQKNGTSLSMGEFLVKKLSIN